MVRALISFLLILFMMMLVDSCTSPPEMKAEVYYKMDMLITNKKHKARGIIVLPEKELYSIILESSGKFNYFTFSTCSREIALENPRKGLNKYKVQVNYRPNIIERRSGCSAEVRGFEIKGRHARGYIVFKSRFMTLPGFIVCGGISKNVEGVSACQERSGLLQSITFDSPVMVKATDGCSLGKEKGQVFEFEINRGFCKFTFMELKSTHRMHYLVTYGHEGKSLRE